jgi:hypothetical protein
MDSIHFVKKHEYKRGKGIKNMSSVNAGGISVTFVPVDRDTAEWIGQTVEEALRRIREEWGLAGPEDCRIYVMTSWSGFFFEAASWPWRFLLAAGFPLWSFRARRMWPYSAGWTQRFGRRIVIGVKPPRLLEISDKSVGVHMFREEKDPQTKIRHLICHELTHACSAHLGLPAWLNEGLATTTVDRFLRKQTMSDESLELVRSFVPKGRPPEYRTLSHLRGEALAYHAVRGYWIVRYLEEVRPGLVRRLLASPRPVEAMERRMAAELGMSPPDFWNTIDGLIAGHFRKEDATGVG